MCVVMYCIAAAAVRNLKKQDIEYICCTLSVARQVKNDRERRCQQFQLTSKTKEMYSRKKTRKLNFKCLRVLETET